MINMQDHDNKIPENIALPKTWNKKQKEKNVIPMTNLSIVNAQKSWLKGVVTPVMRSNIVDATMAVYLQRWLKLIEAFIQVSKL